MQASKQQYGAKSVTLAYQTLAEEKRRYLPFSGSKFF